MATKPEVKTFTTTSNVDILNAMRQFMSNDYNDRIPVATRENIGEIGQLVMSYEPHRNMLVDGLVNRIGLVIATSKAYSNPLKMFKKGIMNFGETVEEYFINIAKANAYDPETAQSELYKIVPPDVLAVFHKVNRKDFYKQTISNEMLAQAFLNENGLFDMISRVVDSMYSGAENDEFLLTKQCVSSALTNGAIFPVKIEEFSDSTAKGIASTIKTYSNNMLFNNNKYTALGVISHTPREDQYLIMTSEFDAKFDVEVLASAFNMDKADFLGHRVLIDEFPGFPEVKCVLCDKDFFMIFDQFMSFTENYNGQGLYWNYFYHVWQVYSVSPFAQAIAFTTGTNTVTAITVTPASPTASAGDTIDFTAKVTGSGKIVPQGVYWEVSGSSAVSSYISYNGKLYIDKNEANTTLTVTARSIYNSSITGTATVTIS